MGRGKKKGKQEAGDVPSVAGLSISEDASTSQTLPEEEEAGLTGGGRKKKQMQPEKSSETAPSDAPTHKPEVVPAKTEEPKEEDIGLGLGTSKKKPRKKKPAGAKQQPGPSMPEAAAPTAPQVSGHLVLQPTLQTAPPQMAGPSDPQQTWQAGPPQMPGPSGPQQTWHAGPPQMPGPSGPQQTWHAGPPQMPGPSGLQQTWQAGPPQMPGPSGPQQTWQAGPPQMSGPSGPQQTEQIKPVQAQPPQMYPTQAAPGIGRGSGRGSVRDAQRQPPSSFPGQAQAPSYPTQQRPGGYPAAPQTQQQRPTGYPQQPTQVHQASVSTPIPTRDVVLTPSNKELTCRYKIPAKILGRSVRCSPTKVMTNYFPMNFKSVKVYRYDVTVAPDKPKKMMPAVFKKVKETHYAKDFIAFDQSKNCYAIQPLKNVPMTGERYVIEIQIADPNNKIMTFQVSFKSTGVVDLGRIKDHMDGLGSSLNTPSEEIQCVDVILRQGALEEYVKCGRQFFRRPANPINLSGGLEMWTGLFQSAIFTSRAFINIDVAHKGFPIQQSMISAITNSFRLDTNNPIEEQRSREVENFQNFIKGLRVVATLVGPPNNGQKREFICNGLAQPPHKLSFFCERDGKKYKTTVADYFQKEKGYRIKYPNLNCMWVGPREKYIYYPMELLEVSYGQAMNRQLNDMQLSNIVKEAATPPIDRKKKIEEAAARMNYSTNNFFKKFGLEISDKFLEVEAKILQPPSLDVGEPRPMIPRRGVWQTNRLVKPQPLESWGFIAIDNSAAGSNYETIRELLLHTGRTLGMKVSEPKLTRFNVRMTDLRNILLQALDDEVRFLFIIISSWARDCYHKIKQMAECDVGILTQCIRDQTASRRMNPQTMKNILLKVNSKLMGINQVLHASMMPACLKNGGVMIVGADVTHPSPDQTSIPSIAAVTASMDDKCFSYNIELSIQTPKKEMIVEFMDMMFDHLKLYRDKNRALPRKIYVFRDGVSEGQFAEVLNSELTAIHRAYQRLSQTEKPEVLFLLVQKRHHTRFFTVPNCANVEPGTVVDTHIVHPKELDFYLVSHQAIKGTARPTRYHAICNDSQISHDEVEQLTYYLCHLYSRCMRAVSYPTPTYYAHLACFRARSLTHGQTFDNKALEKNPKRLRVLDKMLRYSRMFFV